MKTYQIELQRVKSISHVPGLFEMKVDAVVASAPPQDDAAPISRLTLTEDNARLLFTLLRQQIAELDKRKGRSQR